MSLRHVLASDILRHPPRNTLELRETIVTPMLNSVLPAVQLMVQHARMPHFVWAVLCHVLGHAGTLTHELAAETVKELRFEHFDTAFGAKTNRGRGHRSGLPH